MKVQTLQWIFYKSFIEKNVLNSDVLWKLHNIEAAVFWQFW